MFEARLAQGSLFKKIFEALNAMSQHINIEVTSTDLKVQCVDSSSVCLTALEMDASAFDPFRCDKNITIGIELKSFLKVLHCASNDDAITLRAKDDGDTLEVFIENTDQDRVSNFSVKLMDIDTEHLSIPSDIEYSVIVKMPSAELQRIVRDISQFGDSMVIACTKEGVQFSNTPTTTESMAKIMLKEGAAMDKKGEGVSIELVEAVNLTFACRYLALFVKSTPIADTVWFSMKCDAPLCVKYPIGSVGHICHHLAPKVEDKAMDDE